MALITWAPFVKLSLLKIVAFGVKNMETPKAYIIWTGLGVIFMAIILLGVSLLISKIKTIAFLKQYFSLLNHQQTSGNPNMPKIPRVVQYSPVTNTVVIEGMNGKNQTFNYDELE